MNEKSTQRELVNRKRFNTSVDKDLLIELDELSKNTFIPKSKLIDRALELLFEDFKNRPHIRVMRGNEIIHEYNKKD